jgi:hypothetical protein
MYFACRNYSVKKPNHSAEMRRQNEEIGQMKMLIQSSRARWSVIMALCLFVAAFFGKAHRAGAQEVTATINGVVTDPTGGVVPNVEVKVEDLDRGTVWPAKTNASGFYNVSQLPIGRYEVRVTAAGFRTAVE